MSHLSFNSQPSKQFIAEVGKGDNFNTNITTSKSDNLNINITSSKSSTGIIFGESSLFSQNNLAFNNFSSSKNLNVINIDQPNTRNDGISNLFSTFTESKNSSFFNNNLVTSSMNSFFQNTESKSSFNISTNTINNLFHNNNTLPQVSTNQFSLFSNINPQSNFSSSHNWNVFSQNVENQSNLIEDTKYPSEIITNIEKSEYFDPISNSIGLFKTNSSNEILDNNNPKVVIDSVEKHKDKKSNIRRLSREMSNTVQESLSLAIRDIPLKYLNKELLEQHFSQFGNVIRIYLNQKLKSANIYFTNHEDANNAKKNGEIIDINQLPLKIFWRVESNKKSNKIDESGIDKLPVTDEAKLFSLYDSNKEIIKNKILPFDLYNSLKALTGIVAVTANERFNVLEQRDKILKSLNSSKHASLSDATIVQGNCMDMCPEKERYVRQDRRRLTIYEILPGTDITGQNVDHSRAVKEYSRSSADQDMPLPEELRPVEVLDRTMNYLLTNIVDTGDPETWSEWYNFLWDRMRSIRKDITQQHLCDPVVVTLVEKSARFHIVCSELLCEEDVSVFDAKINNENLTKCLQTLKEMYQDLMSRGVSCENEAEFAAYKILMNLNDGDIIYEAQQWSNNIRHSSAVQRSLEIYGVFNSSNYVKFFRLVSEADYITASILHRYFFEMRLIAMQRIVRAYSSFRDASLFPLVDIVKMLGFDEMKEAVSFVSYFGLSTQNDHLVIDKNNFYIPESSVPVKRSFTLVYFKLKTSLSQAINGNPLNDYYIQPATSSFNENNNFVSPFIESLFPASSITNYGSLSSNVPRYDDTAAAHTLNIHQPASMETSRPDVKKQQTAVSKEIIKDLARDLFLEVIGKICLEIAQELLEFLHRRLLFVSVVNETNIQEQLGCFIREICQECVNEQIVKKRICEMDAARLNARENTLNESFNCIVDEIITEEILKFIEMMHYDKIVKDVASTLVNERTTVEIESFIQSFYISNVRRRLHLIQQAQTNIQLLLLKQYFHKWKGKLDLKRYMDSFPSMPNLYSVEPVTNIPRTSPVKVQEVRAEFQQQLEEMRMKLDKEYLLSSGVVDFPYLFAQSCSEECYADKVADDLKAQCLYWKLLLSYSTHNIKLQNWILRKFFSDQKVLEEPLIIETNFEFCTNKRFSFINAFVLLNENVAKIIDASKREEHLKGVSATLHIIETIEKNLLSKSWQQEKVKFKELVKNCGQSPIIILIDNNLSLADLFTVLDINEDINIVDIIQYNYDDFTNLNNQLNESLKKLISISVQSQPVYCGSIAAVFYDLMTHFFFKKLFFTIHMKTNDCFNDLHLQEIIICYNQVLSSITQMLIKDSRYFDVSTTDSKKYSSGIEMPINKTAMISEASEMLALDDFKIKSLNGRQSTPNDLYQYINMIQSKFPQYKNDILISKVESLLYKWNNGEINDVSLDSDRLVQDNKENVSIKLISGFIHKDKYSQGRHDDVSMNRDNEFFFKNRHNKNINEKISIERTSEMIWGEDEMKYLKYDFPYHQFVFLCFEHLLTCLQQISLNHQVLISYKAESFKNIPLLNLEFYYINNMTYSYNFEAENNSRYNKRTNTDHGGSYFSIKRKKSSKLVKQKYSKSSHLEDQLISNSTNDYDIMFGKNHGKGVFNYDSNLEYNIDDILDNVQTPFKCQNYSLIDNLQHNRESEKTRINSVNNPSNTFPSNLQTLGEYSINKDLTKDVTKELDSQIQAEKLLSLSYEKYLQVSLESVCNCESYCKINCLKPVICTQNCKLDKYNCSANSTNTSKLKNIDSNLISQNEFKNISSKVFDLEYAASDLQTFLQSEKEANCILEQKLRFLKDCL